jgi:hypothetical protein
MPKEINRLVPKLSRIFFGRQLGVWLSALSLPSAASWPLPAGPKTIPAPAWM